LSLSPLDSLDPFDQSNSLQSTGLASPSPSWGIDSNGNPSSLPPTIKVPYLPFEIPSGSLNLLSADAGKEENLLSIIVGLILLAAGIFAFDFTKQAITTTVKTGSRIAEVASV
jgi:hypothetical protein